VVDNHGPIGLYWQETPNEEDNLDQPIKGEPTKDNVGKELSSCKEGIYNPVCQPLLVVFMVM